MLRISVILRGGQQARLATAARESLPQLFSFTTSGYDRLVALPCEAQIQSEQAVLFVKPKEIAALHVEGDADDVARLGLELQDHHAKLRT